MKLTLALESQTLKPLAFLINEANVSEPKIYPILKELKRRSNKSRRRYLC
jgi:hypothetical protein